jgi:hypothetical protein
MAFAEVDERTSGRIIVHVNYVDKERMKQIPGATWSAKDTAWKAPLAWSTYVLLQSIFSPSIEYGPKLQEWAGIAYHQRIKPAEELREVKSFSDPEAETLPMLPLSAEIVRSWPTRGKTA